VGALRSDTGIWGGFFDYDRWMADILVVNGHIDPDIQKYRQLKYAEPPHLFRNWRKGSLRK